MRRLDRSKVPTPMVLGKYDYRHNSWDREPGKTPISSEDKKAVREALAIGQRSLCAYCEGPSGRKAHIEHFYQRARFPKETFVWRNLFLSCDNKHSCGRCKDSREKSYHPQNLIKPDEEDPSALMQFQRSGRVEARPNLNPRDKLRFEETRRVFNLNCGPLLNARRTAIEIFLRSEPGLFNGLKAFNTDERIAYVDLLLKATEGKPHATAIRHFLEMVR